MIKYKIFSKEDRYEEKNIIKLIKEEKDPAELVSLQDELSSLRNDIKTKKIEKDATLGVVNKKG